MYGSCITAADPSLPHSSASSRNVAQSKAATASSASPPADEAMTDVAGSAASRKRAASSTATPASSSADDSKRLKGDAPAAASTAVALVDHLLPGQVQTNPSLGPILLNRQRRVKTLKITNFDDRPIQVGSHYHLLELNPLMSLDRGQAYGFRLNIAAGTAVRFEPGVSREVEVVEIGGEQIIKGGNGKMASHTASPPSSLPRVRVRRG